MEEKIRAYNAEQVEKRQILDRLLAEYNDGRKKTLFCLAVNLLPLEDLRTVFADDDLGLPGPRQSQTDGKEAEREKQHRAETAKEKMKPE